MTQEELDSHQESYLTGAWPYFVRAVKWAKQYHLKVLPGLHAAPGSQNGWPHSGRSGDALWGTGDTIDRTLEILERLAVKLKELENNSETSGVISGLNILNEPYPGRLQGGLAVVKQFYLQAYPVIRRHLPADKYAFVIDHAFSGFTGSTEWRDFMQPPQFKNVILDMHLYHCFDAGLRRASFDTHISATCNNDRKQIWNNTLPTIVGEWSLAYKVETGQSMGEPYPNATQQAFLKQFAASQMKVYEASPGIGWIFWNFKTEESPMGNFLLGVEGGWMPVHYPSNEVNNACSNVNENVPRKCANHYKII
jgi:glucan 1,3-beta-glucosidase